MNTLWGQKQKRVLGRAHWVWAVWGVLSSFLLVLLPLSPALASPPVSHGKSKTLSPEKRARLEKISLEYLNARQDARARINEHQERKDRVRKQIRELKEKNAQQQAKLAGSPGELETWSQDYKQQMKALQTQIGQLFEEQGAFDLEKSTRFREFQQTRRDIFLN